MMGERKTNIVTIWRMVWDGWLEIKIGRMGLGPCNREKNQGDFYREELII